MTTQAACWAGGRDPQETGDPLVIKTSCFSDLAMSVQKATCTQAMYERDVLKRSPTLASTDPVRLTLFICGLPDSLKTNGQGCIQTPCACAMNAAAAAVQPLSDQVHITTWSEFQQEIINYAIWAGLI